MPVQSNLFFKSKNLMIKRVSTALGRFLLFFLAFGVALVSMRYWSFETIDFLQMKTEEVLSNQLFRISFYGHVIFGPLALMSGPFQFLPKFRAKRMQLHRLIGKVYIIAVLFSGLAGLGAAQWTPGGEFTQLGFSLLALSWLYTTTKAYLSIRNLDIDAHQQWMLRSYALTLAAVTLRIYLPLLQGPIGLSFIEAYQVVGWMCWIPNLIVIEIWIRKRMMSFE